MLLTRKTDSARVAGPRLSRAMGARIATMDRRAFLKRSGLAAGAGAFASQLPLRHDAARREAADDTADVQDAKCSAPSARTARSAARSTPWSRTACGCARSRCSIRRSTSARTARRARRCASTATASTGCKYADEARQRQVPADQLGPGDQRDRRQAARRSARKRAPTRCSGSARSKHSNEQSYLLRKFVSYLRQQQLRPPGAHLPLDHGRRRRQHLGLRRDDELVQRHAEHASARCTSARNAAEAHPVSMLHMLHAKETGAKMIVVDPRFTRTAAKADEYVRIRSGTDIAFLFGMLHHIFKNGWEDKKYIHDRVYGMDKVKRGRDGQVDAGQGRGSLRRARGAGVQGRRDDGRRTGRRRSSGAWARRSTRSATRSCARRASCSSRSATSACPAAAPTSSAATTTCRARPTSARTRIRCPATTASPTGSWKHFAQVWGVDYEWIKKQFASQAMMEKPGMTVSRWIDGVLEKNELIDQDCNLRALVFWGHAPNSADARQAR